MLNKKICQQCFKRRNVEWDFEDENDWNGEEYNPHVHCFSEWQSRFAFVEGEPPEWCNYYLEQFLLQKGEK